MTSGATPNAFRRRDIDCLTLSGATETLPHPASTSAAGDTTCPAFSISSFSRRHCGHRMRRLCESQWRVRDDARKRESDRRKRANGKGRAKESGRRLRAGQGIRREATGESADHRRRSSAGRRKPADRLREGRCASRLQTKSGRVHEIIVRACAAASGWHGQLRGTCPDRRRTRADRRRRLSFGADL